MGVFYTYDRCERVSDDGCDSVANVLYVTTPMCAKCAVEQMTLDTERLLSPFPAMA